MPFSQLIFVLVAPQLPENIGAVARVIANFLPPTVQSPEILRVVSPHCSVLHEKALATAAGADFMLKEAGIFNSVAEAVADCQWVYGTCATQRSMTKIYSPVRVAMAEIIHHPGKTAILFGPERTGLINEDQVRCRSILQIPVNVNFSSLNLAQAVSIITYERFILEQSSMNSAPLNTHWLQTGESFPASHNHRQAFLDSLEHHLDAVQFWRIPHKKPIMWQNIQNIFTRMDLTDQEVRTLWGLIRRLFHFSPK